VLTRRHVALFDGAFFRVAPLTLEKELHTFAAAEAADGTVISSHI
jgi:hypothetical protein